MAASLCFCVAACKGNPNQQSAHRTNLQKVEAPLPPPTLDEVRAKADSIYHGALIVDRGRTPAFLAGDFNADTSQDILVVVRPNASRLADLNNDLAAWIVDDPRLIWVPDPNKVAQKMPPPSRHPVRERAADRLWVIIHGFREKGWRNPIATQSYLLVNAAPTCSTGRAVITP